MLGGSARWRIFPEWQVCRVLGGNRVRRPKRNEKCNQRFHFLRRKVIAIGGHVAASLDDLADQFRRIHSCTDGGKIWAAVTASIAHDVAIPALFALEHKRAL